MNNKISKDQKYNLQITLLLIRETFRMLYYSSNKKTPLKKNNPVEKMCISLGITPKILQNFIFTDSKKIPDEIKNSCTILESIGFPSNLMNGEKPLTMSNKLLCSLYDYFFQSNDLDKKNEENEENKKNNTFREDFLKKLKEDYYTILNPDGSSFFECVVWLYNFVYHPKFDNEILKIKKFLKNTTVGELPNSPKEYSKIMVENYYNYYGIDKSYQTPKAKSHGKGKKDKEKNKENFPKLTEILKLKINLFLIKESLLIYLKTDGIREADGLEEFYNCLGTNKESYDNAIEKDTDITIYFYEFIQSGFPANLFRTDSPTLMPMSDGVKKTVLEYYYNKIDIEKFREKFYAEFVYKTSSENALMAHIANTLLIKIKQQISKEAKKSS